MQFLHKINSIRMLINNKVKAFVSIKDSPKAKMFIKTYLDLDY
jgi:hypothetical protein